MVPSRTYTPSVVVITGASSGIGRATARAFARRGACLVLAARRASVLDEAVAECASLGADAIAVPTDVTDEAAVQRLARAAIARYGRIDVWVNNAGVVLYGAFVDAPSEAFRRVIETNFFGEVNGSRAALPIFIQQRRGVLINVASGWGEIAAPYVSSYIASKFAVVGFSDSLREEVRGLPDVHVCTLLPSGMDTPLYQHAGNVTGREARPVPPVYKAETAAREIVSLAERPDGRRVAGKVFVLLQGLRAISPEAALRLMGFVMRRFGLGDQPARFTLGNLFEPLPFGRSVSGGWSPLGRQISRSAPIYRLLFGILRNGEREAQGT